jgi:hypothetical protein
MIYKEQAFIYCSFGGCESKIKAPVGQCPFSRWHPVAFLLEGRNVESSIWREE